MKEQGQQLPFVQECIDFGEQLGHLNSYDGSRRREKYQLSNHEGSGFLFSVQPLTIVLQSDRVGLSMELNEALAEQRGKNGMMRN